VGSAASGTSASSGEGAGKHGRARSAAASLEIERPRKDLTYRESILDRRDHPQPPTAAQAGQHVDFPRLSGPLSSNCLVSLTRVGTLANTYRLHGLRAEAEPRYQEALAIQEQAARATDAAAANETRPEPANSSEPTPLAPPTSTSVE
jgi:hypothetical protein